MGKRERIVNGLISLSIFISSITFFKEPFEGYFHYIIFLSLFPLFILRYGVPKFPLKFLAIPLVVSIYYVLTGYNELFSFFKIFMGMVLSITFYQYVFMHYDYNVEKLFRMLLKGYKIVTAIAVIQGIGFILKIGPLYNYKWILNKWGLSYGGLIGIRLNSIFPEPAQFAIMLTPVVFVAVHHLLTRKYTFISFKWCITFLFVFLLTGSSTGYASLFFILIILLINYNHFLDFVVFFTISFTIGGFLYIYIPEFKTRVDAAAGLWVEENLNLENVNSSSFVQYNNFHVAVNNLKEHPIAGTGLGSHATAYEKYSLTKQPDFIIKEGFDFNAQDANSMFLRIMSEMGLIGLTFIVLFIFKFFIHYNSDPSGIRWMISGAILSFILINMFRQGNYFLNGFPFFMWMYYYNKTTIDQPDSTLTHTSSEDPNSLPLH